MRSASRSTCSIRMKGPRAIPQALRSRCLWKPTCRGLIFRCTVTCKASCAGKSLLYGRALDRLGESYFDFLSSPSSSPVAFKPMVSLFSMRGAAFDLSSAMRRGIRGRAINDLWGRGRGLWMSLVLLSISFPEPFALWDSF